MIQFIQCFFYCSMALVGAGDDPVKAKDQGRLSPVVVRAKDNTKVTVDPESSAGLRTHSMLILAKGVDATERKAAAKRLGEELKQIEKSVKALAEAAEADANDEVRLEALSQLKCLVEEMQPALSSLAKLSTDPKAPVRIEALAGLRSAQNYLCTPATERRQDKLVTPPKPEKRALSLAEQASVCLDGEGGICSVTTSVEKGIITLSLRLEHSTFTEEMGHMDAVRCSIKLFSGINGIEKLNVHFCDSKDASIANYCVVRESAMRFAEKLEDPFESRRARDWWPQMSTRVRK